LSFGSERTQRINLRRAARGHPDADQRDGAQDQGRGYKDRGIQRGDPKKKTRNDTRQAKRRRESDRDSANAIRIP
jgi:hypothetical protein